MKNLFITGTDTGVGKTHVTALLLAELRRQGINAGAFKPIACGPGGRNDAKIYQRIMSHQLSFRACEESQTSFRMDSRDSSQARNDKLLDLINPIYLHPPLAPSVAAKLEKRRVDLKSIRRAYSQLTTTHSPILVEGAGGLLVPIKRNYYIADLIRDLDLPVLIVARLGLGTINHTLLTVRQARAAGLQVAGIVLNDTTGRRGLAEKTNIRVLPGLCGAPLLGVIPHGNKPARRGVQEIANQLGYRYP